jgi:hypothetical protein
LAAHTCAIERQTCTPVSGIVMESSDSTGLWVQGSSGQAQCRRVQGPDRHTAVRVRGRHLRFPK